MGGGAMSEAAGEAAYGADMPKSPLHPQPEPIIDAHPDDAHEGSASYSAPRSSFPAAGSSVVHVPAMSASSEPPKQKRGRPRKYTPDGTKPPAIFPAPYPIGVVASPTPALPPGFTLGLWGLGVVRPQAPPALPSPLPPPPSENSKQRAKKKRVWPPRSTTSKKQRELAVPEPGATGFVPQVITIQGGEDVAAKVMSYCGNGWAVFILSAEGAVRNVTLKQPASSPGTVIYEGYFDIVSLSGVYLLSKSNGVSTLKGGFSISLVGHDGSLFGGGLAGPLIAASPVQVVFGRFAADEKEEIKQDVAIGRFAADGKEEIKQDVASGSFTADEEEEIKQDVVSGTPDATTPTAAPNESSIGSGSPSN
ncbi:hypothetical protein CFC21_101304 [Triticum aestivum]|uniref:AT-hook motif nuclear-localized protein n=2 Tax=Triticum aestivum TaxID=4565 RepID=A0A9R1N3V4_WHEAT|nr:hypothetical protein CFC21_101304 [Triticum aestivum]